MPSTKEHLEQAAEHLEAVEWADVDSISGITVSSFTGRLQRAAKNAPDEPTDETPKEAWKRHNESFEYEGPDGPAESWSSEDYIELHDRLIGRRVQWYCQYCSTAPFRSLKKARRHVGQQHGEHLYEKYGGRDE
jgi:hypothetical protein